MIKAGGKHRRGKTQTKQAKKSADSKEKKTSRPTDQEDITTYFVLSTSADASYRFQDSSSLPEVSVPSPDDAALPKSSSLCSINEQEPKINVGITSKIFEPGPESQSEGNDELLQRRGELTTYSPTKTETKNEVLKYVFSPNTNGVLLKKKNKKGEFEMKNHQLTEFFPIRRSNRKTLCNVMKERQKMVEDAILSGNEDGFEIKEFPGKGRGVITNKGLKRGEFVLEYYGELIDVEEAKKRESYYAAKENTGCYMYYFKHQNIQYCIDATKESGRLGRLVNHSKKGNLKTQPFFIQDSPHLILIARQDILPGEELLYDYGDRSKKSLEAHPWLAL